MVKLFRFNTVFLAVIGLLIFFHYLRVLAPIENLILNILNPVQEKIYNLGKNLNNFCSSTVDQSLYDEISKLAIENAKLKILEKENQILKEKLNFFEENQNKFVLARIIGQDPLESNALILNKGEESGIKIGFPVIVNEGIMIGKIVKVEKNVSTVLFLTDSRSKVAAFVLKQNEGSEKQNAKEQFVSGIVLGKHGLSIRMELIPQNEKITRGDLVITSGLEKDIPQGLLIGKIDSVTNEAEAVFQSAAVKSFALFDNLSIVAVIIP